MPRVAVRAAENDTATVQVGLQGLFVKVAVTPVGKPEAENVTAAVVPLMRVVTIDDDVLADPWITVRLAGEGAASWKSKGGGVVDVENFQESAKLPVELEPPKSMT